MNEIKKIHLGRQPFTISVEAHRELRAYLDAIERQVGKRGEEVLKEVELRMAELLTERNITADKVVLAEDVDFLKEQLGKPGDFKDESGDEVESENGTDSGADEQRRLFRDTDNAMVAGVASGLAAYLRIDPLIVRLLFVVFTFTGAAGLILYILMWILVPEAKTQGERLQMRGKAVTVDNIKRVIDRADVPGAASRAGTALGRGLTTFFKVCLSVAGAVLAAIGFLLLISVATISIYFLVHGGQLGSDVVFPLGSREVIGLIAAGVASAMASLFILLTGLTMMRRKWFVPGWATATIVGLFLVGASLGTALAYEAVPGVRQRIKDAHKTQVRPLTEFKNVVAIGEDTRFLFHPSDTYYATISYMGKVTEQNVQLIVEGDTLKIDSSKFMDQTLCIIFCVTDMRDLEIRIYAPSVDHVTVRGDDASFISVDELKQQRMTLDVAHNSRATINYAYTEEVRISEPRRGGNRVIEMSNIKSGQGANHDMITILEESVTVDRADRLRIETDQTCSYEPIVYYQDQPTEIRVRDNPPIRSADELRSLQNPDISNDYNCVLPL